MPRVFIASRNAVERAALHALIAELNTKVVGEAADWAMVLALSPKVKPDLIVIDWNVMVDVQTSTVSPLQEVCPDAAVVILMSRLDARQQPAISAGADVLINKDERSDRLVENLRCTIDAIRPATPGERQVENNRLPKQASV
ncbi:MAG: response regulator transcription factor [Caldilineaceae bacterium]|jgi:DNA-binding NarL/FixJ family response regulator|nr:response regulator transcription factor [Caldilineaceae bacterium]